MVRLICLCCFLLFPAVLAAQVAQPYLNQARSNHNPAVVAAQRTSNLSTSRSSQSGEGTTSYGSWEDQEEIQQEQSKLLWQTNLGQRRLEAEVLLSGKETRSLTFGADGSSQRGSSYVDQGFYLLLDLPSAGSFNAGVGLSRWSRQEDSFGYENTETALGGGLTLPLADEWTAGLALAWVTSQGTGLVDGNRFDSALGLAYGSSDLHLEWAYLRSPEAKTKGTDDLSEKIHRQRIEQRMGLEALAWGLLWELHRVQVSTKAFGSRTYEKNREEQHLSYGLGLPAGEGGLFASLSILQSQLVEGNTEEQTTGSLLTVGYQF